MKLREFYRLAIETGMDNDPRGRKKTEKLLKQAKESFIELKAEKKKYFDRDRLINPYADTRILNGDKDAEIKKILVGIDMEAGEIVLADRLMEKQKIDLVLSHHPEGRGLANLHEVMSIHSDVAASFGVSITAAEGVMLTRIKEIERRLMPVNHFRAVDAAKLLGLNFMCAHTVADNCVANYLQKKMDAEKPETIKDLLELLLEIPEYSLSEAAGVGPSLIAGRDNAKAGRIMVDMTGGTEGSKDLIEKWAQAGVNTVVGMHFSEEHRKEMEKHYINAVIAGHISSDNLGLNLLFDEIIKKGGKLEFIECSGFRRVKR